VALFASPEKRNLVLCLLLAVITLAVYNPVNRHPFVNYDDDRYVTENAHVRAGLTWDTFVWALTSTEQSNWHPLTWMSHALDCQFFHLNAAGHHFTSLLIHAVNAMLLFLLLAVVTQRIWPSLLVAALFALHPVNVESVAWVAERKNVLCTLFFLLTLGAYGWYAQKPHWTRYLAVLALFAAALASKPMAITLPFVLLLLDWWPLKRDTGNASPQRSWAWLACEKIPFLLLSAGSAIITLQAQQSGGAVRSTLQFPLGVRLQNAVVAYAMYLQKAVWPVRLAPLYPHPGGSLSAWQIALSAVVLFAISAAVLKLPSRRYLAVGWLWFLGTLVPVIGLVQVGDAAMADRYAYIPLIGIFVMLTWGISDLAVAYHFGLAWRVVPAVCVLVALGLATTRQLSYWSSNYDLWSHALAVTRKNYIAENNLGGALVLLGRAAEACPHFEAAAEINPRDPMSHFNMGACLQDGGNLNGAIQQYHTTIELTSDRLLLASAYANQGTAYRDLGDDRDARDSYDQALKLNPAQFNAYLGLGRLLEQAGNLTEAIANYTQSVELRPTDEGYIFLGRALQAAGRRQEALAAYQAALKIAPASAEAQQAVDALTAGRP